MTELADILADSRIAGVYRYRADFDRLAAAAAEADLALHRVSLSGAYGKAEALDAIGRILEFPDWYGANFDALQDCLADLDWRRHAGHIVLLERCHGFIGAAPHEFAVLVDVFLAAADEVREQEMPLWCLIDVEAPGIPDLPEA